MDAGYLCTRWRLAYGLGTGACPDWWCDGIHVMGSRNGSGEEGCGSGGLWVKLRKRGSFVVNYMRMSRRKLVRDETMKERRKR